MPELTKNEKLQLAIDHLTARLADIVGDEARDPIIDHIADLEALKD